VLKAFGTSEKLTTEGRECSIELFGKVIALVWVRPADAALNPDYRRELAELSIDLKQGQELDEETDRELLYKIFVRTVICRWEWTDPDDQADPTLELNEENAIALFKSAPKFFEAIQRAARTWTNYRTEHEKAAAGN
jgi:hypothetical protein